MKNIGIILPNLINNQLSYTIIGHINQLLQENNNLSFTIFCEDFTKPHLRALCPVVNVLMITSFNGLLISTNLSTTAKAINCIHNNKHIFYVWDLEWIRNKNLNYQKAFQVYDSVDLYTRSVSYAKAISNYTNKSVKVIPDFNLYEFRNLV